ncbi:chromosome condensation protein CrcB [Mycolicibacter engbaekii]|uniref:Fluoride-specific ion channel FluC n=1 Tax=Mycolicibacter engbaekii TaxID=188915 RepID=A0A1X1TT44_9MYCO|nr:CrcB family protein [Mycolicibacter engbaekii]ORV47558.1 chromosome condensation protein CrcB [Mycolicibacter engbaekii]
MTWLLVAAGAAVGAPLRYLTDRFVQARHDTTFPWGTFIANMLGSLILGVLTGSVGGGDERLQLLIGTGLCGALTTYSSFSYETLQLAGAGARLYAVTNLVLTVTCGLGAYYAGGFAAKMVWV